MTFAAVAQRVAGTSGNNVAETLHTIAVPAASPGDLLLVVIGVDGTQGYDTLTVNTASSGPGWAKLVQADATGGGPATAIFWKKMGAPGESNALVINSGAMDDESQHIVLRIPSGGTPTATATAVGNSANSNPPLHTPPGGAQDFLWITVHAADTTAQATVAPTLFSNLFTSTTVSGTGCSVATAERQLNAASLDPGTFTSPTESWVAFTIAVPFAGVTHTKTGKAAGARTGSGSKLLGLEHLRAGRAAAGRAAGGAAAVQATNPRTGGGARGHGITGARQVLTFTKRGGAVRGHTLAGEKIRFTLLKFGRAVRGSGPSGTGGRIPSQLLMPVNTGAVVQTIEMQRILPDRAPTSVTSESPPLAVAKHMALGTTRVDSVVQRAYAASTALAPAITASVSPPMTVGYIGNPTRPTRAGLPPVIYTGGIRVMAQTIVSGTWVHRELPIGGLNITTRLSGPQMVGGVVDPENRELTELLVALPPWGTWLHVEEAGEVRASGIMLPHSVSEDGRLTVTAVGVTGYAARIPYVADYAGVDVDPIAVMRHLWDHVQSFPRGNLGVTVTGASPVRIGEPSAPPETTPQLSNKTRAAQAIHERMTTGAQIYEDWTWPGAPDNVTTYNDALLEEWNGQGSAVTWLATYIAAAVNAAPADVSATDGPYRVRGFELPAIGRVIDQLAQDTPFEYVEEQGWADPLVKNNVYHRIRAQHPVVGRRLDLNFTQGENIIEHGEFEEPDDAYADSAWVKGAGEGADSIIGYSGVSVAERLRMPTVVTDKTIQTKKLAVSRAAAEVAYRLASIEELPQIAVNVRHPNAPWGSFAAGDEILPRVRLPYYGAFAQWHRITQIDYDPEAGIAVCTLTRRSSYRG